MVVEDQVSWDHSQNYVIIYQLDKIWVEHWLEVSECWPHINSKWKYISYHENCKIHTMTSMSFKIICWFWMNSKKFNSNVEPYLECSLIVFHYIGHNINYNCGISLYLSIKSQCRITNNSFCQHEFYHIDHIVITHFPQMQQL